MNKPFFVTKTDEPFTGGWAILHFQGDKAHWFKSIGDNQFEAICGFKGFTSDKVPAFTKLESGTMPYCKKCLKVRNRK